MNNKIFYTIFLFFSFLFLTPALSQTCGNTIDSEFTNTSFVTDNFAYGQAITLPVGDSYNNIQFNFIEHSSGNDLAIGNLYILSAEHLGTPANLSASPNLVGTSTGITNDKWVFDASVVLNASTQYWFYMESHSGTDIRRGSGRASGRKAYFADGLGGAFDNFAPYANDLNFELCENVPTPSNPDVPTLSEWGLIILALLLMTAGTLYLVQPSTQFEQK